LARRGHRIVVAGRDLGRAFAVARTLEGASHEAVRAEAADFDSCRRAVRGAAVVAVCAGPFSTLGDAPARAALAERAHYVGIADDRAYIAALRAADPEFKAAGRCAVFGASSLPGVSSVLAATLAGTGPAPRHARVTLFN